MARVLYKDETHSIKDICTSLGISRTTLYRCLDADAGEVEATEQPRQPEQEPPPA